jgi:spore coat polysaccharide biosynthesis protein SpsF
LPNKLFLPFYNNNGIINILIEGFLNCVDPLSKIILATSDNQADDVFIDIAGKYGIELFRGDEQDVLNRFVQAASFYKIDNIVRVCADNPIYDYCGTIELLKSHLAMDSDYTAFELEGGIPSIKSHLGFWGEVVSLRALKKIQERTNEKVFIEHVTNYIYTHPDNFVINFIKTSPKFYSRKDVRLTVDTIEDFEMVKNIYAALKFNNESIRIDDVIDFIDTNAYYLEIMKKQILENSK